MSALQAIPAAQKTGKSTIPVLFKLAADPRRRATQPHHPDATDSSMSMDCVIGNGPGGYRALQVRPD